MTHCNPADMLVFARVAELRSISGASRAIPMSKASVSRAVTRLEDALGVRLLERTSRHVVVTEIGRGFLLHCRRVREEIESAEAAVGELRGSVQGQLRVAVPLVFGRSVLAPVLSRFLLAHPKLRLELQITNRIVDPIEEGFDLVVRIGEQPDSSLLQRELGRARYGVFASPDHVARHGPFTVPGDLSGHAVLDVFNGMERAEWKFSQGAERFGVEVVPRLDLNDAVIRREVALDGVGIAMLPMWICADAVAQGRLLRLLPDFACERVSVISALWPSRRHALPRLRALIDFLAEIVPQEIVESGGDE